MGEVIENINGRRIVTGIIELVNGKRVQYPCKPYDADTKEYVDLT